MILLTAVRIDVRGRCRFTIQAGGGDERVTSDPAKAAKILYHLGVPSPLQLIEHVQQWGSVEIVEGSAAAPKRRRAGREPLRTAYAAEMSAAAD